MTNLAFSTAEQEAMRDARIALFEDRMILEAQPPIDSNTLREIAACCSGPIPEPLLALWAVSFGGELDYALEGSFGGHHAALSFTEIFYPGSDGYRDLWGWIDHERELAAEAAAQRGREARAELDVLPFGGFEYLERMYVLVAKGPDHGAVLAWQKGLPPAWRFRLHQDSVTSLAPDVRELFRMLHLESDPEDGDDDGVRMLEAIDELAQLGDAGRSAADSLRQVVRRAVLDWRDAVRDGSIASRGALRRRALEHAAREDDVELMKRLVALRCDPTEALRGGAPVLDHALAASSSRTARWLLDIGVPVTSALRNAAQSLEVDLAVELLAAGSRPDAIGALNAASAGRLETALAIARALPSDDASSLARSAQEAAARADAVAARVASGQTLSNESEARHRARADALRSLANAIAGAG